MAIDAAHKAREASSGELDDEALERISGGLGSVDGGQAQTVGADVQSPATPEVSSAGTGSILKTKHDTVKNSISNVR